MVLVHVPLVELLNAGAICLLEMEARHFLEHLVVDQLANVPQVLIEALVLRSLFLLAEQIADVDMKDQNDLPHGHERRVEGQLDGTQAHFLYLLVEAGEVSGDRGVIVVVDEEVYQSVAHHTKLLLQQQVDVGHALVLGVCHIPDLLLEEEAERFHAVARIHNFVGELLLLFQGHAFHGELSHRYQVKMLHNF